MDTIQTDTCWLDGNKCPYGFPNGRFQDRPTQICHLGDGGCEKLVAVKEMADEYNESELQERVDAAKDAMIEKGQVSLSSELRVIAEGEFVGELGEKILKLVADMIEDHDCDKKIIRVDDI